MYDYNDWRDSCSYLTIAQVRPISIRSLGVHRWRAAVFHRKHHNAIHNAGDLTKRLLFKILTIRKIVQNFALTWGGFHIRRLQIFPVFVPPPPCHCHKSADSVPLVCFLGTPSPTHYGRHIWKPPNCIGEIHNVEIVPPWQSSSKPFTYGVCLNELGRDTVHQYVGQEPSGRMFNELSLDNNSEENFIEFSVIFPRGWGSYNWKVT